MASKRWLVRLTGPDVRAESRFTSESKAYEFVRSVLGPDSPADTARVECLENGRWVHFETVSR